MYVCMYTVCVKRSCLCTQGDGFAGADSDMWDLEADKVCVIDACMTAYLWGRVLKAYICVYVCFDLYVYIHIYTYMYMYILFIYIYICIYIYVYVCIYMYCESTPCTSVIYVIFLFMYMYVHSYVKRPCFYNQGDVSAAAIYVYILDF